jgi:hypothetical protein
MGSSFLNNLGVEVHYQSDHGGSQKKISKNANDNISSNFTLVFYDRHQFRSNKDR